MCVPVDMTKCNISWSMLCFARSSSSRCNNNGDKNNANDKTDDDDNYNDNNIRIVNVYTSPGLTRALRVAYNMYIYNK